MTLRASRPKVNSITNAVMLRCLVDGPHTRDELREETGLGSSAVGDYIRALRRQRLIYLVDKLPDLGGCRTIELWQWGPDRRDAYKRTTDAQRAAAYRARKTLKKDTQHLLLRGPYDDRFL